MEDYCPTILGLVVELGNIIGDFLSDFLLQRVTARNDVDLPLPFYLYTLY